ncbi:MAG: VWA domain-containing protein [Lentisphaerae bacterium]|nr:VWA domain-containing protein [Lentisphaerota bacterium]
MKTNAMAWMAAAAIAAGLAPMAPAKTTDGVQCRVELDRAVLPAGGPQRAVVKVTLDAPRPPETERRPPVNLALVLDRSGSMSGDKIERAKEAAIEAVRRLGPDDLVSVVVYDHEVDTIVPAQRAANAEWIEGRIRSIRSRGNTALFAGVSQGAAEVRRHDDRRFTHRILLLSDGLANTGPAQPADLERLGRALMKERISVTTIGLGTDYNEDLMTRLAQASDGNSYFVEHSRDLPRIFAAELGDVLSVAAREVRIEIEFPAGVRPLRIVGREGRLDDRRVEIALNQLYGGQSKYALVEVEVPAARASDVREIALARCRYENAYTQRNEDASGRVEARFSEDAAEVTRSGNGAVVVEFLRNEVAIQSDEAIELNDQGRNREAATKLRAAQSRVQKLAEEFRVEGEVQKDMDAVGAAAEKMEQGGFDNVDRKASRADNFRVYNQQMK